MGTVEVNEIPIEENKAMAKCLLDTIKEFFSEPENQAKYEAWKARNKCEGKIVA